ncbi:MAG: glycosyltransferase family 39 protein, partial [Tepidisphaeraceae bacterium]
FEMGRLILGNRGGLLSAVAVSSGLLFLKYMRQTTSDVHLAMWVTIANALLLHGLLRGRWWLASIGGGFAVGMAFLCKGPVSLVETVVPLLGGLALMRGHGPGIASDSGRASLRAAAVRWAALRWAVGVLVFVVVATPWFLYVYFTVPHVWHTWFSEVTREGATDLEPGRPWMYLLLGVMTWPWVIFGVLGWVGLWLHRRDRRLWLPVLLALLPLAVMVWFRDRKERYMLPMIAPAAVMCGYGLLLWIDGMRQRTRRDWAIAVGHFLLLGGGALALAYLGTRLKTVAGDPWYSRALAGWCAAAIVAWVGLGLLLTRRRPGALVVFTFHAMLGLQARFMLGYARSGGGRSNFKILADIVRARAPTASVYDWLENRHRIDEEFAIYLNRPVLQADPATIVPVDRPAVVIVRQRPDAPPPELPAQWRLLGTMKDHKNQWFAFVRYPEPGPGSNS